MVLDEENSTNARRNFQNRRLPSSAAEVQLLKKKLQKILIKSSAINLNFCTVQLDQPGGQLCQKKVEEKCCEVF